MSDSKVLRAAAHRIAGERAGAPSLWSDYQPRTWAERGVAGKPAAPKTPPAPSAPAGSGGGRHSAITGSLYTYANYKSWAERVRTTWNPDKDKGG